MAPSEELRTRAVEAATYKLARLRVSGATHVDAAQQIVAAAEPFIRELVVGQVVEWLRKEDDGRLTDWPYYAAEAITAEFGGSPMSAERQWPDFEWSPEARLAASEAANAVSGTYTLAGIDRALDAAVKAQPVVALPPCPTCNGERVVFRSPGGGLSGDYYDCLTCDGSGVERMVPLSEIMPRLERATALAERYGEALIAISDALPNVNKVRVILVGLDSEQKFGGNDAD